MTTLTPQPQQVDPKNPTGMAAPWKSYEQFFAGRPEALSMGHYRSSDLPGSAAGKQWGAANPFRFAEEYNKYKSTLPREHQLLAGAGITPESVQSGAIKGVYDRETNKVLPVGVATPEYKAKMAAGSGSQFGLSSDVLNKMWR